jgi:CBS domain-containing protein
VMTPEVTWVGPDTDLQEIARKMRDEDFGAVPVAEQDRLIGMITDRDIVVRCVAAGMDVCSATARQVMSPHILYCFDDESVESVLQNMGANQIRRLPVVNREKRLVGVISLGDLSQTYERPAAAALKEISARDE